MPIERVRGGAVDLLAAVLDRGQIMGEHALSDLPPPRRAEARAIADMALRRLGEIDAVLDRFLDRMPPPPTCHMLRVMTAEIMHMGRAPHAAVNGAVTLARAEPRARRLASLVNAVGRRLQGAGEPKRPATINTPGWLAEALRADWGQKTADAIMRAHRDLPAHDLTLKTEADREPLAAEIGGTLLPSGTLRLQGRPQISSLLGFDQGSWWVQDAAAALPARLLEGEPGALEDKRVLDLCAAPGGKTMQLAAMGAQVTALDANEGRMARLSENLARTKLSAEIVVADARDWRPEAPFDAILLDAPCSATGTMRRHPDLAWRLEPDMIGALLELQESLLARAWGWLAPGGTLVYATCSLLRAEGEAQIESFLQAMPGAQRHPLGADDPILPPDAVTPDGDLRTTPAMLAEIGGIDGFFAARLTHAV